MRGLYHVDQWTSRSFERLKDWIDARLAQASAEVKDYQSDHRYSLEEYGLSKEVITHELEDVFEAYGFQKGFH